MVIVEQLAQRVAQHSGAALLIDYGQNKPYGNSLTAIRKHEGVHPLSQPGTADVSAWVDFAAMRVAAEEATSATATATATTSSSSSGRDGADEKASAEGTGSGRGTEEGRSKHGGSRGSGGGSCVDVYGPVSQGHLLLSLGIQTRVEMLAQVSRR